MHCSAFVPSGINGEEFGASRRIGHLIATQELLSDCRESRIAHVGVATNCITVPDIYLRVCERGAAGSAQARDVEDETQGTACVQLTVAGVRSDVGAVELVVDKVRTFSLSGPGDAGRRRSEEHTSELQSPYDL